MKLIKALYKLSVWYIKQLYLEKTYKMSVHTSKAYGREYKEKYLPELRRARIAFINPHPWNEISQQMTNPDSDTKRYLIWARR